MATPEELALQQPGFANLPPEQQDQIIRRIRLRMAASTTTPATAPTSSVDETKPGTPVQQTQNGQVTGPKKPNPYGQAVMEAAPLAVTYAAGGSPGTVGAVTNTLMAAQNFGNIPDDKKATYAQQQAALSAANYFTYGLASVAEHFGRNQWGGTMSKFDKLDAKTNPATIFLNKTGLFSSKNKQQQGRDVTRDILQDQLHVYDDDFNYTLLDGTKVNMGLDGSIKNYMINPDDKAAQALIPALNPFAFLVTGGDRDRASALVGEFANALKNSANPMAEIKALYEKAGLDAKTTNELLTKLEIPKEELAIFQNSVNEVNPGAQQQQSSGGGGGFRISIPKFNFPKPKPVDTVSPYRMGLLQDLLGKNSQPIQYPSQKRERTVNPTANNFNATMNKIIGG